MHRFFVLACAVLLFALAGARPSAAVSPGESSERLYHDALRLLQKGRDYEACINKLREAVRLESANSDYHLALGCALADRAIIVFHAACQERDFREKQTSYKTLLADWEKNRQDLTNYKGPLVLLPPLPPVPPATADDDKPFGLSEKEARKTFDMLSEAACLEWEAALQSATTDKQKASVHYVKGWGLTMLRICKHDPTNRVPVSPEQARPRCLEEMQKATQLASQEPQYWQGLGDLYCLPDFTRAEEYDFDPKDEKIGLDEVIVAYRRCVALQENNVSAWYMLSGLECSRALVEPKNDTAPAEAALRQALHFDKHNAFLWYELARLQQIGFSPHNERELSPSQSLIVLSTNEKGNRAGRFQFVGLRPRLPSLLAAAWSFTTYEGVKWDDFDDFDGYLGAPAARWYGVDCNNFASLCWHNVRAALKTNNRSLARRWVEVQWNRGRATAQPILSGSLSIDSATYEEADRAAMGDYLIRFAVGNFDELSKNAAPNDFTQEPLRQARFLARWVASFKQLHRKNYAPPFHDSVR